MNFNEPRLVAARAKAKDGTITFEELKEAISLMREGRSSAHIVSAKSRAAKAPIDAGELLKSLDLDF